MSYPRRFIDLLVGNSTNDRVSVSSYGILLNYLNLKKKLSDPPYSYEFTSSTLNGTTAEVIARLLHRYMSIGFDLPSSATMMSADLRGRFSFIASDLKKSVMVAVKHGEPVIAFKNEDGCYLTMDVRALRGRNPGEVYFLNDGELALATSSGELTIHDAALFHDGVALLVDFLPYDPDNELMSLRHAAHIEARKLNA